MFNSGILNVAIGIVFIYLLVSLIVTAVNELIAAIFKMRGRVLWQGLCTLLPSGTKKENMAEQVYRHPLIAGLSHSGRPSYIPSHTFALALLDVISGGTGHIAKLKQLEGKIDLLPAHLSRSLNLLLHESKGDLEKFRMNIEAWFNDSMDRVSGVYKRKSTIRPFLSRFRARDFPEHRHDRAGEPPVARFGLARRTCRECNVGGESTGSSEQCR